MFSEKEGCHVIYSYDAVVFKLSLSKLAESLLYHWRAKYSGLDGFVIQLSVSDSESNWMRDRLLKTL